MSPKPRRACFQKRVIVLDAASASTFVLAVDYLERVAPECGGNA